MSNPTIPRYEPSEAEGRLLNELADFVEAEIDLEHSFASIRSEVESRIRFGLNNIGFDNYIEMRQCETRVKHYIAGYIDARAAMVME